MSRSSDSQLIFREARAEDIPELHRVRMSVKENALNNPALVTPKDYEEFLTTRGKGWLCESNGVVAGFAIVDVIDHNIWALFLHPDQEKKGIGRQLHDQMMNWYFNQSKTSIWLSTSPGTRAEYFYRKAGWRQNGFQPNGEVRFEMSPDEWNSLSSE